MQQNCGFHCRNGDVNSNKGAMALALTDAVQIPNQSLAWPHMRLKLG